jgi:carbonic anhydrase/acetyltransferase-like protein (isoleucine patch superfamily)
MIKNYKDKTPQLSGSFVAENVSIIGDVVVEEGASIWYGTVLRGDVAEIHIGKNTSIQDNSVAHCATGLPTIIGPNCVVGHNAILHSCTVAEGCLIGMGATLLDGCVIGEGCIIGAGSVVSPRKVIPPNSMVMGVPGRVVRQVTEQDRQATAWSVKHYLDYAQEQLEKQD